MKLTAKEMEIMVLLWTEKIPMTANEIIEASKTRTWSKKSIYIMMNSLAEKRAVLHSTPKPTSTNNAKSYIPAISYEDYTLSIMCSMKEYSKSGMSIDYDKIIEGIRAMKEGQ